MTLSELLDHTAELAARRGADLTISITKRDVCAGLSVRGKGVGGTVANNGNPMTSLETALHVTLAKDVERWCPQCGRYSPK